MKQLNKNYIPCEIEDGIYKKWEENKYFEAKNNDKRPYYSVVLPPPNVTGVLHIGHALNISIQDVIVRWKRMNGYNVLWLPGVDHAGIATQNKVERELLSEGKTKDEIGREKFIERVWQWKHKYGDIITTQFRKTGASLDWSRQRFTMDEKLCDAVKEVFVSLYNEGLIYRGEYIVNWCPKDKTALADDEINHEQKNGHLWHIKYPIKDSDKYIVVATTRPETMLGDSGVAVNPNDERYTDLVGKTVILPLVGREIPIVADEYVDKEFGSGAVKMTPSHDPNDFEVAKRCNLEYINVFTEDAKINEKGGKYQGLDRFKARKEIVKDLENEGYLLKIEDHENSVGHCYRCDEIIEPRISKQWFVKMQPLAKEALKVVQNGDIKLEPKRTEKIYYNWLNNIRDWCISRQIWWGHNIPAYYDKDGNVFVAKSFEQACEMAKTTELIQDPDVLDTWFSSALWPFSTLGWPEDTEDLKDFFPTTDLFTGPDIIFFWVARMIMLSLHFKKSIPFKYVYFNSIVRDEIGRKMSKSLGNSPDTLKIMKEKGADSLRFALIFNTTKGQDIRFSDALVDMGYSFANKVFNASKFVISNLSDYDNSFNVKKENLKFEDNWIFSRYNNALKQIDTELNNYNLDLAAKVAYEFFKGDFCDWYVEIAKTRIYGATDLEDKKTAQYVLRYILDGSLKMMHPFIPFITEYIWQIVKFEGESLVISKYPLCDDNLINEKIEKEFEFLKEAVTNIRNIKAEAGAPYSKKIELIIKTNDNIEKEILISNQKILEKLANVEKVSEKEIPSLVGFRVVQNTELFVPLEDLINKEKEIEKLEKEIEKLDKELQRVLAKLNNESFISKAPQAVIEKEKGIKLELETKIEKLKENISKFLK